MTNAFRVTHRSIGLRSLQGLQNNLDRVGRLQQQLSSGKEISRPSDAPTSTVASLRFRGELRTHEQYTRNAEDGLGWLGTIDSALTGSLATLRRARDLTLTGMSTGSSSPEAREAMAVEVEQLRQHLISMSNTTYLDRPVFGGTTPGQRAYDETGSYLGDDNAVTRTVGDSVQVRVDVTGPEAFGIGTNDVFSVLADIASNLRNNTAALTDDLGRLDAVTRGMQNRLADIGARYNRVEQARHTAENRILTLTSDLSGVEDIDLPKKIVEMQMQQSAYQAALGATKHVVQPSLIDFLR